MVSLNLNDPLTFLLLVILGAVVAFGVMAALREIIASAILLAKSREERQKAEKELRDLQERGKRR